MKILKFNNFYNLDLYRNKAHQLIPDWAYAYFKVYDQFSVLSPVTISHNKMALLGVLIEIFICIVLLR